MRRTTVGTNPVPWLGMAAAVVLVMALTWLTTDEPGPVSAAPSAAPTTSEGVRAFSGFDVLEQMLIAPAPPYGRAPEGQDGTGRRTEESLVAAAAAGGGTSSVDVRDGLRAGHFLGGVKRGWVSSVDGSAVLVTIDEFGTLAGAAGWATGLATGLYDQPGAADVPTSITRNAVRFDVSTDRGIQHQVAYVIRQGSRVAVVKLATFGTLDLTAAEGHARAQAERMAATP